MRFFFLGAGMLEFLFVNDSASQWYFYSILFIYLFTAELGPHCCASFSLVVVSRGCSPDAVHEPLLLWSMGFRVHWLQ